jgi:NADH dehydrogenase
MNAPARLPLPTPETLVERGEWCEIIVVGGGFGGAALARRLRDRLPEGHRLTVVSEESYTTFNPMLAEVVGASVFPEHIVAPLR